MLYTIEYTITGSYTPFLVILRNVDTDLVVDSSVLHEEGTNQFTDLPFGSYNVEVYDTANGVKNNQPPTPTTTTTTTTLPPNPPIFVALRSAFAFSTTNTNTTFDNPDTDIDLYFTTDPNNTQFPNGSSTTEPPLTSPMTFQFIITPASNGGRVSAVGGADGITPQNVVTSTSWSLSANNQSGIVLPVGFTNGYIRIGQRTNLSGADDFDVVVFSNENPFGLPSDTTDNAYQLRTVDGDTYGYTFIDTDGIDITKAVSDGGGGGFG